MKNLLFRAAWKWLPKLPPKVVLGGSAAVADLVWLVNPASVRMLKKNLESLSGEPASRRLVRAGVRSYFRAFAQQLTLPGWSEDLLRRSTVYPKAQQTRELMEDGPVVLALTHSGNWDLAGAWFTQNYGPILTVAEKLEPKDLFDQFVAFRESLGMEIIGVGKNEHVFGELVDRARGRSLLVPLLADRDISGTGVEVMLGESRALVAAGPAALALRLERPLIAGHISYEKDQRGDWIIRAHFTDPIDVPDVAPGETEVEALTRAWVRAIEDVMVRYRVDWHMMQRVFVDDLDPKRLARAKARRGSTQAGKVS